MLFRETSFSMKHMHFFNVLLITKENVCIGLTLKIVYMSSTGRSDINRRIKINGKIESIDLMRKRFSVFPSLVCAFESCEKIPLVCASEPHGSLKYLLKSFFSLRHR